MSSSATARLKCSKNSAGQVRAPRRRARPNRRTPPARTGWSPGSDRRSCTWGPASAPPCRQRMAWASSTPSYSSPRWKSSWAVDASAAAFPAARGACASTRTVPASTRTSKSIHSWPVSASHWEVRSRTAIEFPAAVIRSVGAAPISRLRQEGRPDFCDRPRIFLPSLYGQSLRSTRTWFSKSGYAVAHQSPIRIKAITPRRQPLAASAAPENPLFPTASNPHGQTSWPHNSVASPIGGPTPGGSQRGRNELIDMGGIGAGV